MNNSPLGRFHAQSVERQETKISDQSISKREDREMVSDSVAFAAAPVAAIASGTEDGSNLDHLIEHNPLLDEVDSAPEVALEELDKYVGQFGRLLSRPKEGSLLHFASKAGVRKLDIESYVYNRLGRNVMMNIFDDTVCPWTYTVFALVLPHSAALDLAESVAAGAKQSGESVFTILARITGYKIEGRGDMMNVLRASLRRNQKLMDIVMAMVAKKKN